MWRRNNATPKSAKAPCRYTAGLNLFLSIGVVSCVIGNVLMANGTVTVGYKIKDLETEISTLALRNQQLEVGMRKAQSLEYVKSAIPMLGMVDAGKPVYLDAKTDVAMR